MTSARAVEAVTKMLKFVGGEQPCATGSCCAAERVLMAEAFDAFAAEAVREFYDSLKESVRRHAEHCLCNACEFLRTRHADEGANGRT